MSVVRAIALLTVLVAGGEAVARGVRTLLDQRKFLVEGLATTIAERLCTDSRYLGKFIELIFQQKRGYMLRLDEHDFVRHIEMHVPTLPNEEFVVRLMSVVARLSDAQGFEDDAETLRYETADYLAAHRAKLVFDGLVSYFEVKFDVLSFLGLDFHRLRAYRRMRDLRQTVRETYLHTLHDRELESLASALGRDDLLLLATAAPSHSATR